MRRENISESLFWFLFQIATFLKINTAPSFFFYFCSLTGTLSVFRTNIAMIEMQEPSNSLVYITPLKLIRNAFLLGVMIGKRKYLISRIIYDALRDLLAFVQFKT